MSVARENCWALLRDAGIVSGPAPAAMRPESPWYVRLLLGFSGWFAALFLLGFVAAALGWVIESEVASILVGLAMMACCWFMLRRWQHSDFISQGAMAASFCGQALFVYGLFKLLDADIDDATPWLIIAALQGALASVMPSAFHRLWSAFAAAASVQVALFAHDLQFLGPPIVMALTAWLWLNAWSWPARMRQLRPIGYGLAVALVGMVNTAASATYVAGLTGVPREPGPLPPWTGELLLGAVFLWGVWALLKRWQVFVPGRAAIAALVVAVLLVLASMKAPGITVGVGILLLGYANGNRLLTALGIVALLWYISSYYYLLDATLLVKAGWLAATGVVVLVGRWLLRQTWFVHREPGHA